MEAGGFTDHVGEHGRDGQICCEGDDDNLRAHHGSGAFAVTDMAVRRWMALEWALKRKDFNVSTWTRPPLATMAAASRRVTTSTAERVGHISQKSSEKLLLLTGRPAGLGGFRISGAKGRQSPPPSSLPTS